MGFMNEIKDAEQEVKTFSREVVAKRVFIVAAVVAILNIAVAYGWITPDISDYATSWVNRVLDVLGVVAGIAAVRPAVTPVKSPRNDAGTPMVPASQAEALAADAAYRAKQEAGVLPPDTSAL